MWTLGDVPQKCELYLCLVSLVRDLVRSILDWLRDDVSDLVLGLLSLMLEIVNRIACMMLSLVHVCPGFML